MDEINNNIPEYELNWKVDDFDVSLDEKNWDYTEFMNYCSSLVVDLMEIRSK